MQSLNKQKIEQAFDKGAENYDWAGLIQREVAEKLMSFTPENLPRTILEIGCGTGFLTKMLIKKFPEAQITAIDISGKMIEKCQSKLPFIDFEKEDAETYIPSQKFDLIISNMTVQWFEDSVAGLERLKSFLKPNGQMLFSTLGQKNFWQWQDVLKDLNLTSGLLSAPIYNDIIEEQEEPVMYQHPIDFIKGLKDIGASHSKAPTLSPSQLKSACNLFQSKHCCNMTWHILYGRFTQPA